MNYATAKFEAIQEVIKLGAAAPSLVTLTEDEVNDLIDSGNANEDLFTHWANAKDTAAYEIGMMRGL